MTELKNGIMITSDNLKEIIQTISGLLRYNGILRYNLAEIAIQNTDGADIDITETLHAYGFNLDVFDEPTTDYIKSNFK